MSSLTSALSAISPSIGPSGDVHRSTKLSPLAGQFRGMYIPTLAEHELDG